MAAPRSSRIPIRGWLVPLVVLAVGLIVGKNDAWTAGAALAVLLIGSVMVAVHHAELVALWLGEPYGTLVLALAVTIIDADEDHLHCRVRGTRRRSRMVG
jgi:Ca2+:H+ antiporter